LALKSDGTVTAWGYNNFGQATVPAGLSGVTAIAAGDFHSLALKSDGTVVAWGANQTFDGSPSLQATVPTGLSGVTSIAGGGYHSLAVVLPTPLVGNTQVQPNIDSSPPGTARAFRYTASTAGTVKKLSVYLDAASTATAVQIGLYTNGPHGRPGRLLTSGRITHPVAGTWNTISVPCAAIRAGSPYWLAVLAPRKVGTIKFRDRPGATGGPTQSSAQKNLTHLPSSWKAGHRFAKSPASLYATSG